MNLYGGFNILGVNTLYRLFCFFKLFLMVGKGLNKQELKVWRVELLWPLSGTHMYIFWRFQHVKQSFNPLNCILFFTK